MNTQTVPPQSTDGETLRERLLKYRRTVVEPASKIIARLKNIAASLNMKEGAADFERIHLRLNEDNFNLIIVGRFKNGKSTFVNALLGKPEGGTLLERGPMPTKTLPCTAVLTSVKYAERPYVRVWRFDGTYEDWSFEKYLNEATIKRNEEETQRAFMHIREFEVGYPSALLKEGLTLIDSPGLDDVPQRDSITKGAIKQSDAAIIVYRSDSFAGTKERDFVKYELNNVKSFTVVNMFENPENDEEFDIDEFKGFVWSRLIQDSRKDMYSGQDLTQESIYLLNAMKGYKGKWNSDARLLKESQMLRFEMAVADFLEKDRQREHAKRYMTLADKNALEMTDQVTQRVDALRVNSEKFRAALEAIEPSVRKLKNRINEVNKAFDYHEQLCADEVISSFSSRINRIRVDLEMVIDEAEVPALQGVTGFFAPFRQKKCVEQLLEISNQYVDKQLDNWQTNEITDVVRVRLEALDEELKDISYRIAKDIFDIEFGLNEAVKTKEEPQLISTQERVLAVIGGLFVGDFAAIFGGFSGLRGVAANLAGQFAAAFILGFLGLAGSVIFWPVILVAGILANLGGAGVGFEKRLKRKVSDEVSKKLGEAPYDTAPQIKDKVKSFFKKMRETYLELVQSQVSRQLEEIEQKRLDNEKNKSEKEYQITELEKAKAQIAKERTSLQEILKIGLNAV